MILCVSGREVVSDLCRRKSMRRRIGKAVAVVATAVCMFWCVGCAVSEDTPSPDMVVEEGDVAVSGDEILPSSSEVETETEGLPNDTGSGEMSETVEDPVEESDDKNMIYFVSDDKVWENDLFCAFLEGEATAYDRHQEENLTWPEYFRIHLEENYGHLYGMQLAAEDLDGDGKEELMVMFETNGESTDLYVFHEEDGRLYAWDKKDNFFVMRGDPVILREGGIFEDIGASGGNSIVHYTWRFNGTGESEDIWRRYESVESFTEEDGMQYIRSEVSLCFYEDGECIRELNNIWQMPEGRQDWSGAELVEGDEELDEVYSALIDALPEEIGSFSLPKWADNAVEIPIWEVPGGQGWVSVEDLPENRREFEYVGE